MVQCLDQDNGLNDAKKASNLEAFIDVPEQVTKEDIT